MKLCKDCRLGQTTDAAGRRLCGHPLHLSPVDGEPYKRCLDMREGGPCEGARLFEERQRTPIPAGLIAPLPAAFPGDLPTPTPAALHAALDATPTGDADP